MWKKYSYYLKNLGCANCARELENQLNKKDYYQNVSINFSKLTLALETNKQENVYPMVKQDVQAIEKGVLVLEQKEEESSGYFDLWILFIGLVCFGFSFFFQKFSMVSVIFCFASYGILGYQTFLKAVQLLKKGILNENFLIVISAIGAFLVSKPNEGFMVLFLYQIGKYFEKKATGNVRKNVSELLALKPTVAHKKEGKDYISFSPEEIKKGDILVILKGEQIPLDGTLCSKKALLDTSSLTGESKMSEYHKGDAILSGCINAGEVIEIQVASNYENSTVKRIIDLMEHASDKKAKTENFVERASKYYTPIMMFVAFVIFLVTPFLFSISYQESFYRALMVLVVSCPCAIAISVPLCYFAGLGVMSKHGILVKGSNYIDALVKVKHLVFDKTGTLTTGNFGVTEIKILNSNYTMPMVIQYLVYGERYSTHPLAKSILNQYPDVKNGTVSNVKEFSGKGISYVYQNKKIKLGNEKFVHAKERVEGTVIFIAVDEEVIAYAILGDEIKENAKDCMEVLKQDGVQPIMFTGDHYETAKEVSDKLGINFFESEMLPDDKFHYFESWKTKHSNEVVGFVGDGVNDAPVLRLSDCGIAMGSGSESAIEASDIVIMSSNLEKLCQGRHLAKKTLRILKENLIFALGIKLIVLLFSFFGIGAMWIAVFADVGVTLLAILNSLRILRF